MKDSNLVALKIRETTARIDDIRREVLLRHDTIQKLPIRLKRKRKGIRGEISSPEVMLDRCWRHHGQRAWSCVLLFSRCRYIYLTQERSVSPHWFKRGYQFRGKKTRMYTKVSTESRTKITAETKTIPLNHKINVEITDHTIKKKIANETTNNKDPLLSVVLQLHRRLNDGTQRYIAFRGIYLC